MSYFHLLPFNLEKLNRNQRDNLLIALFSSAGISVTDVDAILDRFTPGSKSSSAGTREQEDDEMFKNAVLEWLRTSPRRCRNLPNLMSCLENNGLNWLVVPSVELITSGARHKVVLEVFRKFDAHSDKSEFIEEVAKFLIKQHDPTCKNMAFELLLKSNKR